MRSLKLLLLVAAVCACAQDALPSSALTDDSLQAVHSALFSSFLPVDEMHQDARVSSLLTAARDGIWSSAGQAAPFRQLLVPFADLRSFGAACGIGPYLATTGIGSSPAQPSPDASSTAGAESFATLTPPQRQHLLFLLESCEQNEPRRLAMMVRNFYIVRAYGAIQEPLTGVHLNLAAPHAWIEQHRPLLPPTRLRYDREKHEIASIDGAIDYLVVGSGPAGSVLAHELRRGGKRVVLVERGSFVVPGAMETRLTSELIDTRTSADGAILIRNGMAVGGGSQVNVDLCFAPTLPAIQAKINSWRKDGRIGPGDFTYGELATAYAWVKRAIGTRVLTKAEINPNNHALWDGALREGLHPKLYDLNTYPPGQSPYPVTDKRSSESQLVIEALQDRKNRLSLLPDADVLRVLFEATDRTATGVEIRMRAAISNDGVITDPNGLGIAAGETVTIHARTVILSAGALGSPTILLRSGVANDQIGRGVVLHPSMPVLGKFDRTIDALIGTQASVFVDDRLIDRGYALESMSAEPLYAALMSPGPPMHTFEMIQSYRNLAGFGVMLVDSASRDNRLVLDEHGGPRIEYQISAADKQRFSQGVAEAVRVMFLAGAKQVYLPTTEDIWGLRLAMDRGLSQRSLPASSKQIASKNIYVSFPIDPSCPRRTCRRPTRWARAPETASWGATSMSGERGNSMSSTAASFQPRSARTPCRVSIPSRRYSPIATDLRCPMSS